MVGRGPFSELNELIAAHDMIPPGCTVLCAVSGGADSVYLLHRLYELRCSLDFRLVAAHYNHHLRGAESDRDEAFVRDFVARYCGEARVITPRGEILLPPVELVVGEGDVAAEAGRRGTGLEDAARSMRYAFLEETARCVGADRIATAHTADDNGETLLLHLLRGSGLQGLAGIRPARGRLIRPMLTTTRQTVEEYLRIYGLPHVEDSSNGEDAFLRNRLRHQVMPLLEELAPGFAERSRDTLAYLRADQDYLDGQADKLCDQACGGEGELYLPAKVIAGAPDPLAVRTVRQLLCRLRAGEDRVSAAHLLSVVALCRGEDPSGRVSLPGGLAAWREYELLYLGAAEVPGGLEAQKVAPPCVLPVGGWMLECGYADTAPESGENDGFFYFDCAMLRDGLLVRSRRTGDELTLPNRSRRSLKRLLIDKKIPRRYRDSLPVLADEQGVLAVAGIGPDCHRMARPGQRALRVRFTMKETERTTEYGNA